MNCSLIERMRGLELYSLLERRRDLELYSLIEEAWPWAV